MHLCSVQFLFLAGECSEVLPMSSEELILFTDLQNNQKRNYLFSLDKKHLDFYTSKNAYIKEHGLWLRNSSVEEHMLSLCGALQSSALK
jgi:hypothetical protein